VDVPSQRAESGEGAVVGSVGTVAVVDAPSQRVECGEGAVVGSVGSVDVVDAPSQRVECGEGAVVGSVGSVDVVDVPSQRVESSEGDLCWLSKSAACIYGRQDPVLSFWASSSTDSFDEISGTSSSAMSQGVLRFSNRAGMGVECRQDVLVHEVAAGVGDATSLQADMVHGKGEDAEPGASRGRYQTATRQDKTDEDSTGDASVAGSVVSVDVARQRVECGEGAVVGSVGPVDVVDAPSQRVECGGGGSCRLEEQMSPGG